MAEQPRASFDEDHTLPQATPSRDDQTAQQQIGTGQYHTQQQIEPPTVSIPFDTVPRFGPASEANEIGTLGPYRVVRELGRGGMGAVYLGFDERLQRRVALKVMLPKFAAVDAAKHRFLREARAAADLTHDHVVTIHEADERDGITYMAMQLLHGEPLDTHIKNNPRLDLTDVLRIGRETALGLAAAHGKGLVHRDIKPANLWLEALNGRVKVLDFGIAKPVKGEQDETENTDTGEIVGTPSYMAPEQALGEKIDFRADLYSLGVVLYRLCAGRLPFTGTTAMAVLNAAINTEATPVGDLNPDVPEPLADLIRRLMAKRPEDRPASAEAVAEELRQIELGRTAALTAPMQFIPVSSAALPGRGVVRTDPFLNIDVTPDAGSTVVHLSGPVPVQRSKAPKWPLFALAALCVTVLALTPALIRLMTPKGVLVIDAAEGEAEVVIKKDGAVVVERSKGREFALKAGEHYTIELAEPREGVRLVPDRFDIAKNGRTTVKVRVEGASGPPRPKEVAVAEFQEVHGVTPAALKAWADKLPRGTRPVWVSPRAGARPVVLDAVALPTPNEPEWAIDTLPDGQPAQYADRLKAGFHPALSVPLPPDATLWLWLKAERPRPYWSGNRAFLDDRLAGDRRPAVLTAQLIGDEVLYAADFVPGEKTGWETRPDVSPEELAELMADRRARGSRPASVTIHQNRAPTRFAVVFRESKPNVEWEFTPDLSVAEYEKQLAERRAKGFRPQCVASQVGQGIATYSVVWESVIDQDRRGAEWALSVGGTVRIDGGNDELRHASELPRTPFALTTVHLPVTGSWPEAELATLKNCKRLTGFWTGGARLSDAATANLQDLLDLTLLELGKSAITGAGFERLKNLTELRGLGLGQSRIKDDALATVARFHKLIWLSLTGAEITDAGLAHLEGLARLEKLDLRDTKVTAAGVTRLAEKLPACEITWGESNVEPPAKSPADLERAAAEAVLAAGGGVQVQGRQDFIRGAAKLPAEPFVVIGVDFRGATKPPAAALAALHHGRHLKYLNLEGATLVDADLAALDNCETLSYLDLGKTAVTDAGLVHVQACRALVTASFAHTAVTPKGLALLNDCTNLDHFNVTDMNLGGNGLAGFHRWPRVTKLFMMNTQLTDADLTALEDMPQLRIVNLLKMPFTKDRLDRLSARLPFASLLCEGGTVRPQPDRHAALVTLSLGGTVRVNGGKPDVAARKDLPKEPFAVTAVRIPWPTAALDDDFRVFPPCGKLEEIAVTTPALTDAGMVHLTGCRAVKNLFLNATKVSDKGAELLKNMPALVALSIDDMSLTDAGLMALADCPKLRTLTLTRTFTSEAGAKAFAAKRPDCPLNWHGKPIKHESQ